MWSGGGVDRLSQTSPIPRSPDGDNNRKWVGDSDHFKPGLSLVVAGPLVV